jgi:hypothetical protein
MVALLDEGLISRNHVENPDTEHRVYLGASVILSTAR